MGKSTLPNKLIVEEEPLVWFFPGMARSVFFLSGEPQFFHLEYALNIYGDPEVIGTIIGPGFGSVLQIEPFEAKLMRLPDKSRYLIAMVHNYMDKPQAFNLDFLFDGQMVQRYNYTIEPKSSLTAYIPVTPSTQLPGPPSAIKAPAETGKGKKGQRKDK